MGVGISGAGQPNFNQDPLGIKKSTQSGVSNITESLMTGGDIGDALSGAVKDMGNNTVNAVKQQAMATVKAQLKDIGSMIATGLKRLFTGNDSADAAKAQTETAGNVTKSATKLTTTQAKLLEGGLAALKDLLTNGEIDINTYAKKVKDACTTIEAKNAAGTELSEQKKEATEKNIEIAEKLKEFGIIISETEGEDKDGEATDLIQITSTDKSGNEVVKQMEVDSSRRARRKATKGLSGEAKDLIKQYQENLTIITGVDEALGAISEEINNTVVQAQTDQQSIQSKKTELTQNVQLESNNIVIDSSNKINTTVTEGNTPLTKNLGDAVKNQAINISTSGAAPGIAASIEASTFGFGSSEAAKVLSNGVADGVAAGIRGLTGSSAMGGLVSNVISGQSLNVALQNAVISEANNMISGTINELASGLQIGELDVGALVAPELANLAQIEAPKDNLA